MPFVITTLLLAGSLLAAKPASLPREKDAWLELSTAHFTLVSNSTKAETKRIGVPVWSVCVRRWARYPPTRP